MKRHSIIWYFMRWQVYIAFMIAGIVGTVTFGFFQWSEMVDGSTAWFKFVDDKESK